MKAGRVRTFHADHVVLGDQPSLSDGAVVVDGEGTIVDVGRADHVLPRHAGATVERVRGVLFPGLVNAHTHLELSSMRGKVPGKRGFVPWVEQLLAVRGETTAHEEASGIDAGVAELVRYATVGVGDVTNSLGVVHALARHGIVGCIFHEVFGLIEEQVQRRIAQLDAEAEARVAEWPTPQLAYAPAPHTLYTLPPAAARSLLSRAEERGARTSLHLAEHPAERRVVEHGDGPAVEWFLRRLGTRRTFRPRPLFELAADVGALRPSVLLVHLTDARNDELALVAKSGASVVLCPRSNLHIEGRLPPLLAMRDLGIEPALGTDSLASNDSLDVLAEARLLDEHSADVPAWELVKMATYNGARALGRSELGRIKRGACPGVYAIELEREAAGEGATLLLENIEAPRRLLAGRGAAKEST